MLLGICEIYLPKVKIQISSFKVNTKQMFFCFIFFFFSVHYEKYHGAGMEKL